MRFLFPVVCICIGFIGMAIANYGTQAGNIGVTALGWVIAALFFVTAFVSIKNPSID